MDIDVYGDDNFGLMIPFESGFFWDHQVNGNACNTIEAEGLYIPLSILVPKNARGKLDDLFSVLVSRNVDHENTSDIWAAIDATLPFEYKQIDSPWYYDGVTTRIMNMEGIQWLIITELLPDYYLTYKMFAQDDIVNKKIMLWYPNSD